MTNTHRRTHINNEDQAQAANERLRLLYKQSAPASVLSLLNSLFVVWLLWGQVSSTAIKLWMLFIVLATTMRVSLFVAYYYAAPSGNKTQDWQLPYALSLLFNGAVWGLGCLLLVQDVALEYQLGVYFFLMGMAAGAISVYSSMRWLALATIYLLLLPMTLAFFASEQTLQIVMALGCSTFMLSILRSSKVLSDKLNNSFLLALQLGREKDKSEIGRENAEQAVAARGEFVASISHEIRTPLMAILGVTDLLKEQKHAPTTSALIESLGESGSQLSSLVNNVLDFSKIDKDELELHARPFCLSSMLRSIQSIFAEQAKSKGLVLELYTSAVSNDYWYGDEQRIRQIIINIVGNALKYTQQGKIAIEAQVRPRNGGVVIAVTDTGVGISQDMLESVFAAYSQVQSKQTEAITGTGLGLSIAQSLTRAMGGEISLASQVGHGSRFQVELPLAPCSRATYEAQEQPQAKQQVELQGLHLLIAEDTPLTQKLIAMFLQDTGARLHFVDNGQQALHAVQNEDYDVVIMDVQMPIMGGMQALKAMHAWQEENGHASVPIILQTADNRVETKKRALAIGAASFLAKPYNRHSLIATIGLAVESGQDKLLEQDAQDAQELAVLHDDLVASVKVDMLAAKAALQDYDVEVAKLHAHNIKGYAGLSQQQQLWKIAGALEDACADSDNMAAALIIVDDMQDWLNNQ